MEEIVYWSAEETARRLRARDLSVAELTDAHLARIEALDPELRAIAEIPSDVRVRARALDREGPPDEGAPLWGVPVTTKINVDQAGCATTNGVAAFKDAVAREDSAVVANLKAAGAVVVGRSNAPEFSLRWFSSNPLHGQTLNPHDPGATPGGSSGGAAAAVAAGMGAIAHGNDIGGSLRYPAFCCGVAALKPSTGRIPAFNPSAVSERPPIAQTMSVQGPIARSIADLRLGYRAMAAGSATDPLWSDAGPLRPRAGALKIGYGRDPFDAGDFDPAIDAAMARALDGLRAMGAELIETPFPGAARAARLWGDLLFTELPLFLGEAAERFASPPMRRVIAEFERCFAKLTLEGFVAALAERVGLQREAAAFFERVDLYLTPTSLQRPFDAERDFERPERFSDILRAQQPLCFVNLLGLPAAALPTHRADGRPVGVQLIGAMRDDAFVLDAAERLERELGPPPRPALG